MVKQLSLFSRVNLNVNRDLKEQMAVSVKESRWSRDEVLDRMNDLAARHGVRLMKGSGSSLTMTTFEKWLNVEAMEHIPPINSLVVFCEAVADNRAMRAVVAPLGVEMIEENDVTLLLWAKEYHRARAARQKMKKLEADL